MDLDRMIEKYQDRRRQRSRTERVSDACRALSELAAAAEGVELPEEARQHVEACLRCKSWVEKFRAVNQDTAAEPVEEEEEETPISISRFWKSMLYLSPMASAACLLIAVWFGWNADSALSTAQRQEQILRSGLDEMIPELDASIQLLEGLQRTNGDPDQVQQQNTQLKKQLDALVQKFETLIRELRESAAEGNPTDDPGE